MSELSMAVSMQEGDFTVFFNYTPGKEDIINRLPEDCEEGYAPECEITGVYVYSDVGGTVDLVELIKEECLEDIQDYILENIDEIK